MAVVIKWLAGNAASVADAAITEVNFGDIVRPGAVTQTFKIGNTGSSIAESVSVTADGADAEAVGWKSFSTDASTFTSSISVPNIAATTGLSGALSARTTVPSNGTTGPHNTSIKVSYVYV